MSVNQTINGSKMLGALELANPVIVTSASGIVTLTAESNSFIANGPEAITSIVGNSDVTQGMYIINWNTVRTLTYNASTLQLIGQANRVTAIGDVGIYQLNGNVTTELSYMPIAGYARKPALISTKVFSTVAQSILNNTATAISWNSTYFNYGGGWSSAYPTRFTAPVAGLYQINGSLWNNGTTSNFNIWFYLNGTTQYGVGGPGNGFATCSSAIYLNVGDYVELFVNQSSGSTQTFIGTAGPHDTSMDCTLIVAYPQ
jgi:hypothetical protein